ncbi:Serine/threonine-protein kinase ULK2 [Geodia barretti]|uniref:Serine/threonine-protein kinase ULK2 n=1 Tax=Geodia barretti TaxID=519541 RepID=A0AA35SYN0_GEOBA|nr:Serine/threonine-protein kinase ULK2 [Geodia barretti]
MWSSCWTITKRSLTSTWSWRYSRPHLPLSCFPFFFLPLSCLVGTPSLTPSLSHSLPNHQYCNGGDLGDYLQTKHTLCEDSIRHLTNHIANALATLHSQHIIHRDIKPQNLLLSYPSPSPSSSSSSSSSLSGSGSAKCDRTITEATIKLADFGFARHLNGTDMAATLCGSPLYMAPEVLLGEKYDGKADLWSVGTIIFQCLTGSAPFLANNPHALRRRYEREKLVAKIPEGTSRHLASLLAKLLRKNPRDRLAHEDLSVHPFLANPSIQASGYLMMAPSPPRAKSSPVPIRRHTPSPSRTPYSSRHSHSQRQSPYEIFVSPSSGPPSIHPVGSASSLARHHSPHSDITDHGFILVESPGLSSSPLSLTSSPHSGSYGSARSHTPSSSGHTPSSYGSSSMQRFRSLTTPFYQATPNSRSSNGSTPTIKGSDVVANSPPNPADYGRPRSHSNTSRRRCSEPQVGVAPLSHTPPFGRLMQLGVAPATAQSPPTNSIHRQTSSSPSPSSPSGHAYQMGNNVGVAVGGARQTLRGGGGGMRYSLVTHGSGSKLTSLSEQAEQEDTQWQREESRRRGSRRGKKAPPANKGDTPSLEKKLERRVFLDQLITASQVLVSDDEEEIDEDEVDFSISLSLQSSQSSNKTDEQEDEEEGGSGSSEVATPKFSVRSGAGRRCKSAGGGEGGRGSFSQQHSEQLAENLQAIHSRAASLSSHQSWLEGSGDSALFAPAAITEYRFEVSLAAEIKPVTPTFQLPRGPPSSQSNLPPQPDRRVPHQCRDGANLNVELPREQWREEGRGGVRVVRKGARGGVIGEGVRVCLAPLQQAVALAGELTAMAQARQGPIMLLSTDLSSSGGVSRSQRHSEQLVLYAKAVAVLDSGLRQFQIQMAASSCELEQGPLRTAEVEAGEMQETCLERARQLREELDKTGSATPSHPSPPSSLHLSAERLLLLEALDMCKHAVLSEQAGETKECVKKYRIAKLIFTHLLSEAKTHRDRTILTNYVQSVTRRIQRLTNNC